MFGVFTFFKHNSLPLAPANAQCYHSSRFSCLFSAWHIAVNRHHSKAKDSASTLGQNSYNEKTAHFFMAVDLDCPKPSLSRYHAKETMNALPGNFPLKGDFVYVWGKYCCKVWQTASISMGLVR